MAIHNIYLKPVAVSSRGEDFPECVLYGGGNNLGGANDWLMFTLERETGCV